MNKELDDLLCQRYPKIFADRRLSMTRTCMCWGFSCGNGWFDLIDARCERLQFWTDRNGAPKVMDAQVKEKYGELRFYPRGAISDEQMGMLCMAEAMSARICDRCGKPGELLVHGHCFMTHCPEHAPAGAITQQAYQALRAQHGS